MATFHKNGCLNRHNCHYYSRGNPYVIGTSFKTNVGKCNVGDHIIGPYSFEETVNSEVYMNFRENQLSAS